MFRNVFQVVVFVQDVADVGVGRLKDVEGVAISILDHTGYLRHSSELLKHRLVHQLRHVLQNRVRTLIFRSFSRFAMHSTPKDSYEFAGPIYTVVR